MAENKTIVKEEKKYERHSIDTAIVNFLRSRDKWSFDNQDKIFFFKELAHLLNGWVSILESVEIIKDSSDNFAVKDITKEIIDYLKSWKSLSYALNRMPEFFNEWDYNIIRSWEGSGNLNIVLESLTKEYSFLQDIKNKYIWALMYPIILLIVAIIAVLALFLLVLPSIFSITDGFVLTKLPVTTQLAKDISEGLKNNRKALWIISTLVIFLSSVFFSTQTGKKILFWFIIQIPVVGKMTKYYYLTKMCRYMKVMLKSGMNFLDMFILLREIMWAWIYQEMIDKVISWLQRWESIYDTLKFESELIPSNVAVLIKVWEETANLEISIDNILNMYQEELNVFINRLAKLIEPIMLIFIWWIVVFIAMAVFGVIFQVMDSAGV